MNHKKWQDWRLNALQELDKSDFDINDEKYITVNESFHQLPSDAKLGLEVRQMRRHLSEIEKRFAKQLESDRVNESDIASWARTYESLTQLDERLHTLLKTMYKGKK